MPHCWKKAESPDLTFTDGLLRKGLNNEKDCKDLCSNNQTCTGVYWGFSAETNAEACYLQMPAAGESGSLTKVTHWSLSNCTGTCTLKKCHCFVFVFCCCLMKRDDETDATSGVVALRGGVRCLRCGRSPVRTH